MQQRIFNHLVTSPIEQVANQGVIDVLDSNPLPAHSAVCL